MKHLNLRLVSTIVLCLTCFESFSQNWTLGGTASPPLNGTNNILGTNANFSLRIQTNSLERMILENGGVGLNGGQMALGNSLPLGFNAVDRLHMNQTSFSNVRLRFTFDGLNQDGTATIGSTATDGSTIGINTFGEFMFTQFENKSMIFQTIWCHRTFPHH